MMFKLDDLIPEYNVQEIEKLFFLRSDLSDVDEVEVTLLLDKLNSIGLKDTRYDNVLLILCTMHDARKINEHNFINEVFLPWIGLKQKTTHHLERVATELSRLKDFEEGSVQDAAHQVNIYRSLVSDLFDPYMTLLVACFQFQEGKFTGLSDADLGNGERTKAEYLTKRVNKLFKGDTFLSGYNPLVRNATSHTGSRGVTYLPNKVVFKNIKREHPVKAETIVWTFEELQLHILQLMECVVSIEAAVEIFGFDCSSIIAGDFQTTLSFAFHVMSTEQVSEYRKRTEGIAENIRVAAQLTEEQKQQLLARMLFCNCDLRKMPCHGARFSKERSEICVDVPIVPLDKDNDEQVVSRVQELTRYAILARTIFQGMYTKVRVAEVDKARSAQRLCGLLEGTDLDDWIEEKAGLLDLVNDSKWSLEGRPMSVEVDFESVQQAELASPDQPFPRRTRSEESS